MDHAGYSGQGRCDEAWVLIPFSKFYINILLTDYCRFVSRINPKAPDRHVILGVVGYDPRKFAEQMNLNLGNGWGIVRTIMDQVRGMKDGKYILVKDPNKALLRLYEVPVGTFEEADGEEDGVEPTVAEEDGEE